MTNLLCFDCESIGLWGETFAVGAVVLDISSGEVLDRFEILNESLLPAAAMNEWVNEHVLPHLTNMERCQSSIALRESFFRFLQAHKQTAEVWVDVGFPVETNFLAAVAHDNLEKRFWEMPYPLHDVSNFVDINIDRIASSGLLNLRQHHPTEDALASATCYLNWLNNH